MQTRLLRRKIIASWHPIDANNLDTLIQVLTDAMTYSSTLRINYLGSGWRTILPYGWHSSKKGNVTLMCYKDTGVIRAYSLHKIKEVLINDSLIDDMPHDRPFEPTITFNDFQMPELPPDIQEDTEPGDEEALPYDDGLKALSTNQIPEEYQDQPEEEQSIEENNDNIFDDFNYNDFDLNLGGDSDNLDSDLDIDNEEIEDENDTDEENNADDGLIDQDLGLDDEEDIEKDSNEKDNNEEDLELDEPDTEQEESQSQEEEEKD